jgi:hypothetical protein
MYRTAGLDKLLNDLRQIVTVGPLGCPVTSKERFTWSVNLRHAAGVNRSTGPRPYCLVSRTATVRVTWPTSTQFPPLLLL